jgi:hypothetical protein
MNRMAVLMAAAGIAIVASLPFGCDDTPPEGTPTGGSGPTGPGSGAGPGSGGTGAMGTGGTGGGEPDCFDNPTTHYEIINACTDAEALEKNPVLPLLNADGSLPPIP